MSSNVSREEPVGSVQDRLSKRFELEAKYLADNAQCEPVKVLFGRDTLSMTQLLPVFDIKTKESKSGGKSGGKVGGAGSVTYYGGLAIAYCVGSVFSIYKIWNGDNLIQNFTGQWGLQLGFNGTDWNNNQKYNEITIPKYGTLRIYQGRPDQLVDPRFWDYTNNTAKEILIDGSKKPDARVLDGPWSAYPNIFYIVSDLFRLGTSNTTPNIRVELQVIPQLFATEIESAGSYDWSSIASDLKLNGIPVLDSQGDTYAPLVIYEYLRNSTWGGAGLDESDIDKASFLDALAVCVQENIAISPCVDEDTSIRNAISQLLEYIDGVLYLTNDGKIAIKCVRTPSSLTNIPVINEDKLVDEPRIDWAGSEDTWGRTIVSFNSRVDDYESTSTGFDSPRYIDYSLEETKVKEVDLPFIKQRIIASRAARRIGNAGATPGCEVELSVLPSLANNYHVGDLIKLSYEKFGISDLLLRINSVTLGTPTNPSATIIAVNQVETDWEIEVDLDNLESGYPSKTTGVVEVPGGFLKPYVLGMFGDPDKKGKSKLKPNQGVVFLERSDVVAAYTFAAYQVGSGQNIDEMDTRWSCYQVKVKIRDWGVSSDPNWVNGQSFLWLEFEAEGNDRKEALSAIFASHRAYITTCAYKNPTFLETEQNTTRMLLPMSFNVLPVNYADNEFYADGFNVIPTVDAETGKFIYKLKVYCAGNISGCVYPDTVSTNKYYPAQTAFVYIHNEGDNPPTIAWFKGPEDKQYILSGKTSYIRANAILADGRTEENGGFFYQGVVHSAYIHKVSYDTNGGDDPLDPTHYTDAWGLPVQNSDGNITLSDFESENVQPASDEEDPTLYIDPERGAIYYYTNGDKTLLDEFDVFYPPISITQLPEHNHDDRYQRIGESAERYYIYREDSTTFDHESGQCGLLHIHLPDETAINITLPSADTAENGDVIEVICSKLAGIEQNTVTLTAAPNESFFYGQSSIIIGVGITVYLICTQQDGQNIWFPDIQPRLNYS